MKNIQNKMNCEGSPHDQSNRRSYDDINILDPDPESNLQFPDEEDDELSDYSLMKLEQDQDLYM